MPISSSDITFRYSTTDGTVGDSVAGDAAGSLGRWVSTTTIADASLHALFPELTGDENAEQNQDYACIFVRNGHPTLTLQRTVVWVVSEVAGGAELAIALDNVGVTDADSAVAQAAQIADKDTAPAGTTAFSKPTSKATGLVIGDIPPDGVIGIWVRRTAVNSPAQLNDGATLRVDGDTAA